MSSKTTSVFLRKINNYNKNNLIDAINTSTQHFPAAFEKIKSADRVLIKPNLLQPTSKETATTTHPNLILALIEYLLQFNIKLAIADSPAFGTVENCLKTYGILDEVRHKGVDVLTFGNNKKYEASKKIHKHKTFTVSSDLDRFEATINLPKLKTHCQMQFTGAVKNLYGCLAGKSKFLRHMMMNNEKLFFAEMLLENARMVNPTLNIGDGIEAMHENGPRGGSIFPLNQLIVSDDYLAFDWIFCIMTGLLPENTHIFKALGKKPTFKTIGDDLEVRNDFIHAEQIDIAFHPLRMVRSILKDQVTRFKK